MYSKIIQSHAAGMMGFMDKMHLNIEFFTANRHAILPCAFYDRLGNQTVAAIWTLG